MSDGTTVSGTAVKEIAGLAEKASSVQQMTVGRYQFTDRAVHRVSIDPKLPSALTFYTLAGLVAYLKAEPFAEKPLVHVVSPVKVQAVSRLTGEDHHLRAVLAEAAYPGAQLLGFQFNKQTSVEDLAIALQTCFQPDVGDVAALRLFIASVKSTSEVGLADDGVSQTVHARSGVAAVKEAPVKNLWQLAPFRTFSEVQQPLSPFVLRFFRGTAPEAALFETGEVRWKVDAVTAVAAYLRQALGSEFDVLG